MKKTIIVSLICSVFSIERASAEIFQWTKNEVHVQYGNLDRAYTNGLDQQTLVTTLQHASGWKYGSAFFFVDLIDAEDTGSDLYSEAYPTLSLSKVTGKDVSVGPIKDFGFVAGVNYAQDGKVMKYLPGLRLSWDVPNFYFLNTDITAYIDDSKGLSKGGVPSEDNSFMFDVNWGTKPFTIGEKHDFTITGHIEYIGGRDNELGNKVESHILGQPQFRYDFGKSLFNKPGHFFAGIEYQFWINKLGDKNTDESAVQALLVGRF